MIDLRGIPATRSDQRVRVEAQGASQIAVPVSIIIFTGKHMVHRKAVHDGGGNSVRIKDGWHSYSVYGNTYKYS